MNQNRYIRFYQEDEDQNDNGIPDWFEDKVTDILQVMKDEDFGSEEQRKSFIDLLSTLHNSKDKRARRVFKLLGNYMTDIADELIEYRVEEDK